MTKQLTPEIESSKEYEGSKLQENPKSCFTLVAAKLDSSSSSEQRCGILYLPQRELVANSGITPVNLSAEMRP
jgi:hypothetical protein